MCLWLRSFVVAISLVAGLECRIAIAQSYNDPLPTPAQQLTVPFVNQPGTLASSVWAMTFETSLETDEGYFQLSHDPSDPGYYPTIWMTGLKPAFYDKEVYFNVTAVQDTYTTAGDLNTPNKYIRRRIRTANYKVNIEVRQWQDTDSDGTVDTHVLLNQYSLDRVVQYVQRVDTYDY